MNLNLLLTSDYWFAIRPMAMSWKSAVLLTACFGLLVALSFAFRSVYRKLKKSDRFMSYVWRRMATASLVMGVFGLVMVFFRYQGVPLFGMRLWYIVWLVGAIAWSISIARYRYQELPKLLAANHEAAIR